MRTLADRLRAVVLVTAVLSCPQAVHAQWSDLGLNGLGVTQVRSGHGFVYACSNNGVYRKVSTTADSAWVLLGFAGQRIHDLLPVSAETLIVARDITGSGADTVALWRSTDGGVNWSPFQNGLGADGASGARRVVALMAPGGMPGTTLATSSQIHRSTDDGMTWETVLGGTQSYHFLTEGPAALWAGGKTGIMTPWVVRSFDDGESWAFSFVSANENDAYAMAFDPSDASVAFLGMFGGLLRTGNNGASWTLLPGPHFGAYLALANRALPPLRLYVNGLPGSQAATFFRTDDEGASWKAISLSGTGHGSVLAMRVHSGPAADTLFLGLTNGMLRYVETDVVGVELPPRPSHLELLAYPSPSHGVTTVSFRLPQAASVSLRVLDSTGREVAMLLGGEQPAGHHNLVWKASNLPSGAYFVQLRAGGESLTRMVFFVQ